MKTLSLSAGRVLLTICSLILSLTNLSGQSFTLTGTNQPGANTDFPIILAAGTTNVSFAIVGTSTAYSHLLVKAGGTPSDLDYDHLATKNNSGTNAICLEAPEFRLTNYVVRIRTPLSSIAHSFILTVVTNATDLRGAIRPATKYFTGTNQGTLATPNWHYYRVEITTNLPGWRIMLTSSNTSPDLYVQRDVLPTTSTYLKRSLSATNDDLAFAAGELTPGAYFIGVQQP